MMYTRKAAKERYNQTAKQLILLFLFTCLGLSLFGTRLFLRATSGHVLRNTHQQAFDQLIQEEQQKQAPTALNRVHWDSSTPKKKVTRSSLS